MWRFAMRWWLRYVGGADGSLAVLSLGGDRDLIWRHPDLAFAVVTALTVRCATGAAVVWVVGLRRRLAEVCLLGGVLWVVALLPLAHGLLLPGPLYGSNPGTVVAVMAAVPAAILAALPLLLDGSAAGRWLARHWLACSIGSGLFWRRARWGHCWPGRGASPLGPGRRGCRDDRRREPGRDVTTAFTSEAAHSPAAD